MRHFGSKGGEGRTRGSVSHALRNEAMRQRTCISRGSSCLGLAADYVLEEVGHVCCSRSAFHRVWATRRQWEVEYDQAWRRRDRSWRKWGGAQDFNWVSTRLSNQSNTRDLRKGQGSEICLRAVFPTYLQTSKCGGGQAVGTKRGKCRCSFRFSTVYRLFHLSFPRFGSPSQSDFHAFPYNPFSSPPALKSMVGSSQAPLVYPMCDKYKGRSVRAAKSS